jgi:hypothetical protein
MGTEKDKTDVSRLTHSLREALASRTRVIFSFGPTQLKGHLVDLAEIGVGRNAAVEHALFLPEEIDANTEGLDQVSGTLSFYSSGGFFQMSATAAFQDSAIPIVRLEKISVSSSEGDRRGTRTVVGETPLSFVCVSLPSGKLVASFELKDISLTAAGGILRVPIELPKEGFRISGRISAGKAAIRLSDATLIRIEADPVKNENSFEYRIAVDLRGEASSRPNVERRRFTRKSTDKFSLLEVTSSLFPDVRISIRITDLSTGGICGQIVEESEQGLLPVGCEILSSGLRGEIVANVNGTIRIKWFFDSNASHKVWEEMLARFFEKSVELRSYESQAVLTLLARSGIKSSNYITSYQVAKELYSPFGEIEKSGNPIVYRAVQRSESGKLEAHIGSFKIADNLWFNGDLFASHQDKTNSTKDFVKEYFESFIEFARASQPYPRIISAWIKGHPYWSALEKAIDSHGAHLVTTRSSIRTILPDIREQIETFQDDAEITIIEPMNAAEIDSLLLEASSSGLDHFLRAFDFDHDRFGSPLLKMNLERSNYNFSRFYLKIKYAEQTCIAVVSKMPEGVSPQRHQNAVWIFVLNKGLDTRQCEKLVGTVIKASVESGTFPSVIRIVGADLSMLNGNDGLVVLADPRMWVLANEN